MMNLYLFFKPKENHELEEIKYLYSARLLSSTECNEFASIAFDGLFTNIAYDKKEYVSRCIDLCNKKVQDDIWVSYDKDRVIESKHKYTVYTSRETMVSNIRAMGFNIPEDFDMLKLNDKERLHHIKLSECKEVDVRNLENIHFIWDVFERTDYGYSHDFTFVNKVNKHHFTGNDFIVGTITRPVNTPIYFDGKTFYGFKVKGSRRVLTKGLTEKEIARLKLLC